MEISDMGKIALVIGSIFFFWLIAQPYKNHWIFLFFFLFETYFCE